VEDKKENTNLGKKCRRKKVRKDEGKVRSKRLK
jgi:hypothetical protein